MACSLEPPLCQPIRLLGLPSSALALAAPSRALQAPHETNQDYMRVCPEDLFAAICGKQSTNRTPDRYQIDRLGRLRAYGFVNFLEIPARFWEPSRRFLNRFFYFFFVFSVLFLLLVICLVFIYLLFSFNFLYFIFLYCFFFLFFYKMFKILNNFSNFIKNIRKFPNLFMFLKILRQVSKSYFLF